ncbi:MAG: hypothetical protein R3B07_10705 [Polyangiaceae bacterium]
MLAGKTAMVCGFGDVGKGSAEAPLLTGSGLRERIDPICAPRRAWQATRSPLSRTRCPTSTCSSPRLVTRTSSPSITWRR